jgi:hypothetical protein
VASVSERRKRFSQRPFLARLFLTWNEAWNHEFEARSPRRAIVATEEDADIPWPVTNGREKRIEQMELFGIGCFETTV